MGDEDDEKTGRNKRFVAQTTPYAGYLMPFSGVTAAYGQSSNKIHKLNQKQQPAPTPEERYEVVQAKLDAARARLNEDQRSKLDDYAERMREDHIYRRKHEIAIANALFEDRPHVHRVADIKHVLASATNEANERSVKREHDRQLTEFKETERKQEAERQAQTQRDREAEVARERQATREGERREALAREPIPGSVDQFAAHLGQKPQTSPKQNQPDPSKPLSANDVQNRFGSPEIEARYGRETQEQKARSSNDLSRPMTAEDHITRAKGPAEKWVQSPAMQEKYIWEDKNGDLIRKGDWGIVRPNRDNGRGSGGRDDNDNDLGL